MEHSKYKRLRGKVANNGFTLKELLILRKSYRKVRNIFHPKLTQDLGFIEVILQNANNSLSALQIYLPIALFFLIPPIVSGREDLFFMPFLFFIFGLWDIYSTARANYVGVLTQLKLMKLGIRILFI
ncbi:hypothetical protein [Enterobacter sp.]|uniref:hypothetical protein n=1 Tax=Enterobacter sp. TaxID=42895 RepID=UPI00296ED67C|nr:hypothetical protein [Enterobacter sp.]